jgi:predicted nucleic acid-binding protein
VAERAARRLKGERARATAARLQRVLALARLYLGRSNVACVATDAEALADAFALVDCHRLGRKRLADTLLAATLLRHGVRQLVTCNPGDFEASAGG